MADTNRRVVLFVAGGVAALIAVVAVTLHVLERPTPECCAHPPPSIHCPSGVAPTCLPREDGKCGWKIPETCTTEPPCKNGGSPPLCNAR